MKACIYVDERYPDYRIFQDDESPNCDVPYETFVEYERITAEYHDMQEKLKRILDDRRKSEAKDALLQYVGLSDAERIAGAFDPDTILHNVRQFDKQVENIHNRSRDGVRLPDGEISAAKRQMVSGRILETFTT